MNWKIIDLLKTWPTMAQVFLAYQLACVGCAFEAFHTVADAIRAYNLQPQGFLAELKKHASGNEAVPAQSSP